MSSAAAQSHAKPAVDGAAELAFAWRDGASRLAHLYQHDPLRVLFPLPPAGEPPEAALVTTSGGLVGGDRLTVTVAARENAACTVVAQAAEKVYRSLGAEAAVSVRLSAAPGAWLEWLPQETILFDGARLRRATLIERAPGSCVLAGEMLVLGRTARGERFRTGFLRDAWEVRRDGRLLWADALHVDDPAAVAGRPACLAGATALATLVLSADHAADHLAAARALLDEGGAATVVGGQLVLRWLGEAPMVREGFGRAWAGLRAGVGGLAPRLPRLWHV